MTAISDTLTGNAALVSTFDLTAETTAAQTAMTGNRSQNQAAQATVTAAFNTQKTALSASIQQLQDQDTTQYNKSVQDAADKVAETGVLKAGILQDKVALSATTIAAMQAHQDWYTATKQSIANGASSALSVLNVPANISNGIQHVQDLYAKLEQLRSSVGGGNYMVFGGMLADLVGLRQIQGAIDGADPYTLERWNKWDRLFNGVSGGITLVTTAIGISRTLSSIVSPCGSPSWGNCFVAGTQIVEDEFAGTLFSDVSPPKVEDPSLSNLFLVGFGIAVGVAGDRIARGEQRKTKPHMGLDEVFTKFPEHDWEEPVSDHVDQGETRIMCHSIISTSGSATERSPDESDSPSIPSLDEAFSSPHTEISPSTIGGSPNMHELTGRSDVQFASSLTKDCSYLWFAGKTWLGLCLLLSSFWLFQSLPLSRETPRRLEAASMSTNAPSAQASAHRYRTRAIEKIVAGQEVLAMDPSTGRVSKRKVLQTFKRVSDHRRILDFVSDAGVKQTLETTDEHPFWLPDSQEFVNAGHLKRGDAVIGPNGERQSIAATRRIEHPNGNSVYNFEVEGFHTYFVKTGGDFAPPILVHNADYVDAGARAPNFNDLPESVLARIRRGDHKGRPFGSPRNPRMPTVEEFNARVQEVRAGDLEATIKNRMHPENPQQAGPVSQLSNEELARLRMEDPISGVEGQGGLGLTGGHHRTAEIIRRVQAGQMSLDTIIGIVVHD